MALMYIFTLKKNPMKDSDLDSLPSQDVLAEDIIENLQSALESIQNLQSKLKTNE